MEQTFAMIKPDAIEHKHLGAIITLLEKNSFEIVKMKKIWLNKPLAQDFYKEHMGKDFFQPLITYMCSAPVVTMVLEKKSAIADYRKLLGDTDPQKAAVGTIRRLFAQSKIHNAAHGSDSIQSAQREIALIFKECL